MEFTVFTLFEVCLWPAQIRLCMVKYDLVTSQWTFLSISRPEKNDSKGEYFSMSRGFLLNFSAPILLHIPENLINAHAAEK